jgi:hypothetical protein
MMEAGGFENRLDEADQTLNHLQTMDSIVVYR